MEEEKKTNYKKICLIIVIIFFVIAIIITGYLVFDRSNKTNPSKIKKDNINYNSPYRITTNSLDSFDLYFLKQENNPVNKIYSPLSIKYALGMLYEAASGESKGQIDAILGDYKGTKYVNNKNMNLANAVFVKEDLKDNIKNSFKSNISNKYNANIIYDSFENASQMNKWAKENTFGLIDNIIDDDQVQQEVFEIMNALAIDMEWVKKIQAADFKDIYSVNYSHENYNHSIYPLGEYNQPKMSFNGSESNDYKALEIGADINKYDIIKELGEEKIKNTVSDAYDEYRETEEGKICTANDDKDQIIADYMKELKANYKRIDYSTDFNFADNENEKVFAKDLKEYDGITLQYVGIMPKNEELTSYIDKMDAVALNNIISNMQDLTIKNFKNGVVTKIVGNIPVFNYDYKLDLKNDLRSIGITDVFDNEKADLSGMLKNNKGYYISSANHKATIDFSNDGIKAAAVTIIGGAGSAGCLFDYEFDVPVETIDLTFDKPYMYLIRNKATGEIWFTGTVYNPSK